MEYAKFQKLRKAKKLKQWQVAKLAGISDLTYSKIENGKGDPQISTIEKIAQAFGVEVGFFFVKEDNSRTIKEPGAEYGCKECRIKDEALLITNTKLIELHENNKALLKSNESLNKAMNKILGCDENSKAS